MDNEIVQCHSEQNESEKSDKKWRKYLKWIEHISVEPTMWLYMMAYMITSVVEQAFFVYKACRVDHGYSEEICSNLTDNETIKREVQVTVSNFHQWNNIAGHVVPIILALFFGNWSDRRGRKLPLIIGLLGVALGSYLYTNVVKSSYTIMFTINTILLVLAMVYSLIRLKWQTLSQQQSLVGTNLLTDFFDKKHVVATFKTMTKSRPNHGKLHLWLLLIIMMLYTFQRDEKLMSFLYTQLKFKWNVTTFSNFRTFQSTTFVIAMLIGIPIMSKLMGMRDTIIVAIGAISHASGRVIFILAKISKLFYVGAGLAALGPIVAPVLRSMTSKLVSTEERGKVFAMLSVCDNAVPLFSGVLYSQLYNATINSAPNSIYWLTFATQVSVLFLILIIHFSTRTQRHLENTQYIDNENDYSSISASTLEPIRKR
ncbi:proton-coupled folate transporter isoform X2 [Frieseomelitta varia]|uniref:proton-coupled folate transporter isoform X2 n=1 Tax=Frieseomelitta varia TaxID=561572 RepID=UPI001CB67D41|nr:proton-coupled folate transporter isoform X2 [Frieseomelitta varia]